ncbi:hypothetical protein Tco_0783769 [Tanacetum coccineum]
MRFMRTDELHKFSDGALISVRNTLHQMDKDFHLGYNKAMKRRLWTRLALSLKGVWMFKHSLLYNLEFSRLRCGNVGDDLSIYLVDGNGLGGVLDGEVDWVWGGEIISGLGLLGGWWWGLLVHHGSLLGALSWKTWLGGGDVVLVGSCEIEGGAMGWEYLAVGFLVLRMDVGWWESCGGDVLVAYQTGVLIEWRGRWERGFGSWGVWEVDVTGIWERCVRVEFDWGAVDIVVIGWGGGLVQAVSGGSWE